MKKIALSLLTSFVLLLTGCKEVKKAEEITRSNEQTTVTTELSDLSVYNLPSTWTTQEGREIELKDLQGNVIVMVMIYTSCKAACPRLVADMRHIETRVTGANKNRLKYVLVSIDPEVDTPERLKAFAKENKMDGDQWLFLRSTEENTREFAATLAVNYKKISPIDFSHSNIISVFNTKGELEYQQEGLGIDYAPTVKAIEHQLALIP
ncbi:MULTISPECIES: SCO family protein [unclassified Myroides]|uniref:SCO family protein n=1 Tax=unclassified Myroides TaxID=2642485 RepID=UPI0015F7EB6A|nr:MULTISPECIES: SCO family protein [unclassified Myroides]MBB1148964.1 SCO family protein [Myroides sp. NP-2]MDM1408150.1 SCO family protein [Myroides sp. DF42-4-2]